MGSEQSKLGKATALNPLIDLDEPELDLDDIEIIERAPDTKRPDYEPDKFAMHVESAEERMTSPPSATYEMLRDSCRSQVADEVPLDEEQIVRPSRRQKIVPPVR